MILVLGILVLAEIALLNMSLLGRCFGAFTPSCPSYVVTLGGRAEWLITSTLREAAGFVVSAVAIYFLYSSKRVDVPGAAALRSSRSRAFCLFGRLALVWIVILFPLYLFDALLAEAETAFPALQASLAMQWLLYIVRTLVIIAFAGIVHARLVLYVPAAAYSDEPESWLGSWRRSRPAATRLFVVFLVIGFIASAMQIGLMALAFVVPGYLTAVDLVSGFLDVRSSYILRNLAQAFVFVLIGLPGTLIEAAASLVAFKILLPAEEQSTADIFN
jgi:hypothetical protein